MILLDLLPTVSLVARNTLQSSPPLELYCQRWCAAGATAACGCRFESTKSGITNSPQNWGPVAERQQVSEVTAGACITLLFFFLGTHPVPTCAADAKEGECPLDNHSHKPVIKVHARLREEPHGMALG